jgi:hypothetical protein
MQDKGIADTGWRIADNGYGMMVKRADMIEMIW